MQHTCRAEILDAIRDILRRSGYDTFTLTDILTEMRRRNSRYAETTIRTHVASHMCGDLAELERVDRATYRLRAPLHRSTGLPPVPALAPAWPWEGAVQSVFVELLGHHGWSIDSVADTATKARGVDVLASRPGRRLGAEVKGWPSAGYADPRRAAEAKRTQPSTQAGHWFSQALFKAMMLLDSHLGRESLMVLPDYSRYRDLTVRTRTGRSLAGIHVVLLNPDGAFVSEFWRP
ncbi:hypothetical protein [Paractinoplanes brasiliensis]|uniref:Uncharacterized protein n=1 Tax=Paractinoplanes brasiliensis TaxID=52695 RepID=A0A4R6JZ66_9ACTN|nr:hypothetical protein [Actinoplanes brasiliensis]TDO42193.1 hypothetical protein C8E87_5959 [Actinoplanes brasiliensis]